jgi:hypothetical protein
VGELNHTPVHTPEWTDVLTAVPPYQQQAVHSAIAISKGLTCV